MNRWIGWLLLFLFLIANVFVFTQQAGTVPAFARKYRLSCNACHIAIPKLKEYGEEFAGNGFVLPDGEEPARATIDTGDESLMLMRDFPIAARIDAFFKAEDNEQVKTDFEVPYGLKLLSGGRIADKVSYYFYFYMDERGAVEGLEDAYLHFNNIGGSNLDIMAGQFQVSDPLFKRELRLSFEDYQIYRVSPGLSQANLTYDRGLMLTYGFDFGLDVVGEVVNGNGIGEASNRLFDMDSPKSFILRGTRDFGPARFGLFGYVGSERLNANDNDIEIWGPDATVTGEKWELNLQYLRRRDSNPDFSSGRENRISGGFAEFVYMPQGDESKWLVTALYNRIDGDGTANDYETASVSLSHMAARNLRVVTEFAYDLERERPRLVFGVVTAF